MCFSGSYQRNSWMDFLGNLMPLGEALLKSNQFFPKMQTRESQIRRGKAIVSPKIETITMQGSDQIIFRIFLLACFV
jgi:hypothetical protein